MRIGLITPLHGKPDSDKPAPSWESVAHIATTAERVGFDMFVYEDALLYRLEGGAEGGWESVAMSGAIAAATDRIRFGQSVINSPYRSPAMVASIASTLDEISAGRYVLGIGAGNTADYDYEAFGFPTDKRYSRFAEAIEIIHTLLKTGAVDFEGEHYSAMEGELVLRGPSPDGPTINIAAGGPKMLGLVAQYADAWNWWGWDETLDQITERMTPLIATLDAACEEVGRDPADLERTLDLYSIVPPGFSAEGVKMEQPVSGSAEEIAAFILALGELGFVEVRCDLTDKGSEAVEAMTDVVRLVHEG